MDTKNTAPELSPAAELDRLPSAPALVPSAGPADMATDNPGGAEPNLAPPLESLAAESDGATGKPGYEVGYKRPPKNTRFQKGQSGNPRGRRPKRMNIQREIQLDFLSKVPVRVGSKTTYVTKIALLVSQLTAKGIKGDVRAALAAFKLAEQFGVLKARDGYRFLQSMYTDLTPEELRIRDQWWEISRRHMLMEKFTEGLRRAGLDTEPSRSDDMGPKEWYRPVPKE